MYIEPTIAQFGCQYVFAMLQHRGHVISGIKHTLIEVRVREGALRREGADNVADAYIDAFLATLDSVNPGLHALLTDPLPDTVAIDRP